MPDFLRFVHIPDSGQTSAHSDDTRSSESGDSESSGSESSDSDREVDKKEKSLSPSIKEKSEYIIIQVKLFVNYISFFQDVLKRVVMVKL